MERYRNQEPNRLRLGIDRLADEAIHQVNQGPIRVIQSSCIDECQRTIAFLQFVRLRNECLRNGTAVSDLELVLLHSRCDDLFPFDLLLFELSWTPDEGTEQGRFATACVTDSNNNFLALDVLDFLLGISESFDDVLKVNWFFLHLVSGKITVWWLESKNLFLHFLLVLFFNFFILERALFFIFLLLSAITQ